MMSKETHKNWNIFNTIVDHSKIRKILLYGTPGTSKTTKACDSAEETGFYSLTLTEESSVSEVIGMWVPKGKKFIWHNGLGIKAWLEGKTLVVNEIDKASGSVLTIMNALLDDKHIANYTLPTGETVHPNKKFRVIATMNGSVSELPESLVDRFDIKLEIARPCAEAIEALPEDLQNLVDLAYSKKTLSITYREIASFGKLRGIIGNDAYIVFGEVANDVKAALALGMRPVIKDELANSLKALIRYWDREDYKDLSPEQLKTRFINVLKNIPVTTTVITKMEYEIENAFGMQRTAPEVFKVQIDKVYDTVISLAKGHPSTTSTTPLPAPTSRSY